ncbi:uncharacterized protein LOC103580217 [Microplitis demolitor]|uniref:uncharacterized protein LOC103580217 n=1 Tax=Microplitis demolitor TaxID=69319 RepID=UPI0004CD2A8E|nr:uncharacterized protein LOC103580217 [Microplitis demolitor]
MKRSCSAPCLVEDDKIKKFKGSNRNEEKNGEHEEKQEPNTREYLQLALKKIIELQNSVNDDTYFNDNTSELGDDTDENVMREVLTNVFKDLPGSSKSMISVIERATKPQPSELNRVRDKSIQLSGYDTCRRVTVDFMRNVVKHTPKYVSNNDNITVNSSNHHNGNDNTINTRRETLTNEYELRHRMLKGLDLHLAVKQRDYTLKLMRL